MPVVWIWLVPIVNLIKKKNTLRSKNKIFFQLEFKSPSILFLAYKKLNYTNKSVLYQYWSNISCAFKWYFKVFFFIIQEPEVAKETIQIQPISNTLLLFTINDLNHLLASEISETRKKKSLQIIITQNGNNSYQHIFSDKSDAENLPLFHSVSWTIM